MALALAPLMAVWAVIAAASAIRSARRDLQSSAQRGLAAATICAAIATTYLVTAMVNRDFSVQFVAGHHSWHMPGRYIASAVLSDAGGALLAWATCAGLASLVATRSVRDGAARAWVILIAAAALAPALGAVAFVSAPLTVVSGAVADGVGISPDLQHPAAVAHAAALMTGAVVVLPAFAITIATLVTATLDRRAAHAVRTWNACAWVALFLGAVAGAQWYARQPMRGPWLADPATALWLFPVVVGAWLVHVDAGRATAERRVMRIFLITAVFVSVMGAVALMSGAVVQGHFSAPGGVSGAWMSVVPIGALVLTAVAVRRSRGALSGDNTIVDAPRHASGAWLAHAGLILVVAAAAGSRMVRVHDVALADSEIFTATDPFGHRWSFASQGVSTLRRENYGSLTVSLLPTRDGAPVGMLSAEVRSYVTDDPAHSARDAFVGGAVTNAFVETRLIITDADTSPETLRIAFVPFAAWLVPGAALLALGTLLPILVPAKEAT